MASFALAPKQEPIKKLKDHGIVVMPSIGAAKHAVKVAGWGADAVMIQGGEGGGHTGPVPTTLLLPDRADAVDIPVVAAGGFFDGRGLAAALSYGAAAVGMGTRFLLTKDSAVPDSVKELYLATDLTGTVVTAKVDGMPHRMLRTPFVEEVEETSAVRRLGPTLRRTRQFKQESGMSWVQLARDGREMRKAQGRTLAQMTLAANTPTLLKAGLVEGDTGAGHPRLGPGGRRDRRPAHVRGAHRPHRHDGGRRAPAQLGLPGLTRLTEEHPQVADDQLGHLERGEVAAPVELRPVHDVVVVALGQRPDGLEVVLEHRDAGPAVADLRLALPERCSA